MLGNRQFLPSIQGQPGRRIVPRRVVEQALLCWETVPHVILHPAESHTPEGLRCRRPSERSTQPTSRQIPKPPSGGGRSRRSFVPCGRAWIAKVATFTRRSRTIIS